MSRSRRFAAAIAMTAVLVPSGGRAATCPKAFVLSGVSSPVTNPGTGNPARVGANLGAVGSGCTAVGPVQIAPETFVLTPGATHIWVGILQSDSNAAPSGSVSINGSNPAHHLTFRLNTFERPDPLTARWESESLALPPGLATVSVTTSVGSVTYTTAP